MNFSMFAVLMIVIVALVAFFHMLQGFFSAALSAVLAIFSAVLALSYHEVIVEKFLGGRMADSAHAMVLLVLFAVIYSILRSVFDAVVPGSLRLPAAMDKAGGAILGAVAGIFVAGLVAVAAQEMSLMPSLAGYARYAVDSTDVTVPGNARTKGQDSFVTDQMTSPTFAESGPPQKMLLPVDDILVDATEHLSDGGALSSEPLARTHPDWLQELFGQRIGMEPGGRRVLMSMPSLKAPEAYTDGVYLMSQRDLPWIDAEFAELRKSTGQKVRTVTNPSPAPTAAGAPASAAKTYPPQYYSAAPGHVLLTVRVRFNHDAADKSTGLVRVSPGAVRLVTAGVDPSGARSGWADNYPVGTLEYRDPRQKSQSRLPRFVMIGQNADDFIFVRAEADTGIDDPDANSPADSGVDFVFNIESKALGWPVLQPGQILDVNGLKLPDGVFIEVKRLARENLSNQKVLAEQDLYKKWSSIRVMRKTDQMDRGLTALGFSGAASGVAGAPAGSGAASTPAPTPAAPTPPPPPVAPPPPPASTFVLDVQDPHDSTSFLSDKFYTNVNANAADGPVTIPGGAMTLEKGKIRQLGIAGATPTELRSAGKDPFIQLAAPEGKALVQLIATPKAGEEAKAWSWKVDFSGLNLKDVNGKEVAGPPIGTWVSYTDGSGKIMGRYNVDGGVSVGDLPAKGAIKKVWFVFAVPHGTKLKSLDQGAGAVVKDLGSIEVP